jgi:hypothetical protein
MVAVIGGRAPALLLLSELPAQSTTDRLKEFLRRGGVFMIEEDGFIRVGARVLSVWGPLHELTCAPTAIFSRCDLNAVFHATILSLPRRLSTI